MKTVIEEALREQLKSHDAKLARRAQRVKTLEAQVRRLETEVKELAQLNDLALAREHFLSAGLHLCKSRVTRLEAELAAATELLVRMQTLRDSQ